MRRSDPWLEIGPCADYGEDNSRSPHICFDRFCGSAAYKLGAGSLGLVTVMLDVLLGGLGGVVHGVVQMALGSVGVVGGYFMVAGFVVLGGFAMMPGGVFVVFGCSEMMFCGLLGHVSSIELGLRIWA